MNSFLAYLNKEFKEGLRNYKFLIVGVSIVILGILDPIMLKLLPKILAKQSNIEIPIEQFMIITQSFSLQNYLNDIAQIVSIVIVFALMGIVSDEINEKTIVFPYSKGVSNTGIVLAKLLNYAIYVPILIFVGFLVNYYYSGILFDSGSIEFQRILYSSGLVSIYFLFNISLIILLSSLSKKSIFAGLSSIGIIFTLPLLGRIFPIKEYLPSNLINQSHAILSSNNVNIESSIIVTILFVILYCILFSIFSIFIMNKRVRN